MWVLGRLRQEDYRFEAIYRRESFYVFENYDLMNKWNLKERKWIKWEANIWSRIEHSSLLQVAITVSVCEWKDTVVPTSVSFRINQQNRNCRRSVLGLAWPGGQATSTWFCLFGLPLIISPTQIQQTMDLITSVKHLTAAPRSVSTWIVREL